MKLEFNNLQADAIQSAVMASPKRVKRILLTKEERHALYKEQDARFVKGSSVAWGPAYRGHFTPAGLPRAIPVFAEEEVTPRKPAKFYDGQKFRFLGGSPRTLRFHGDGSVYVVGPGGSQCNVWPTLADFEEAVKRAQYTPV